MQSKFSQGTILSFLKDVISGAITGKTDRLEIAPPVDTDERQIVGTIDNPIARRCLVLSWEIRQEVERVTKEHLQAHEKGQHDPAECAKVHDLVAVLGRRRDAVRDLFWQYVYAQFPNLRGVDTSVGPNWEIHVAMGANIAPKVLFDDGHPAVTFVNDLERLLSGNDIGLDVSNIVHGKVAEGETIIGSVEDPTLRALRALRARVLADLPNSQEELDQMLRGAHLDFATNPDARFNTQRSQADLADGIFWAAARDLIPGAKDPDIIGIRETWQLVSVPEDESDDTLAGALLGALLGRPSKVTVLRI